MLSISKKLIVLLKFLNKIINKYPKENSTLANPSIKKLNVNKFKSSFKLPVKIEKQYKIIQIISEKISK